MKEQWKIYLDTRSDNVRNTRGCVWQVSNLGNVRKNGKEYNLNLNGGYYSFSHYAVHRAVAELFIPNPNNYNEVDHIDGNTLNNNVDNLRWVTHQENMNNPVRLKRSSIAMTGKLLGDKHPMYGKHHTEEARKHMSENHANVSGENNPMYGKPYLESRRKKQSKSMKDKYKNGYVNPMYGKHHSEETRKRMSDAAKNRHNKNK